MSLLLPLTAHASVLFEGVQTFLEVDPAPIFTSTQLATVEFDVPGIGGRVTMELGTETTPPAPNERPLMYDMRIRIENFASSSNALSTITLSGFSAIATFVGDLEGSSDAPSPADLIGAERSTGSGDEVTLDFDALFPALALSPGETSFDVYLRFDRTGTPLSTFHVAAINGVPVDPELAVQRTDDDITDGIGRWTSHRRTIDPPETLFTVWDTFTSPTPDRIDRIRMTANYVEQVNVGANPVAQPNTDRFVISIAEQLPGLPPTLLHQETISMGVVTTTFLGNFESNGPGTGVFHPFYEFDIPLEVGFTMARDQEYLLFIRSVTDGNYQPVMNWVDAEPGQSLDGESFQVTSPTTVEIRPNDRAFEIEVPEPGFAAGIVAGLGWLGAGGRARRRRG